MTRNPISVNADLPKEEARKLILNSGSHILVVVDRDRGVEGIVSELDVLKGGEDASRVADVMDRDVVRIHDDFDVQEASNLLAEEGKPALVVVDASGELVGIVTPRDIVRGIVAAEVPLRLSVESAAIYLAMTRSREYETYWLEKGGNYGYKAAITQVGAGPEKLAIKLRESMIAAAAARGVISEEAREKIAVSNAVRDAYAQLAMINPGLGGGFKLSVVRGEGRVSVAIFGRFGHALVDGPEQLAVGYSVI